METDNKKIGLLRFCAFSVGLLIAFILGFFIWSFSLGFFGYLAKQLNTAGAAPHETVSTSSPFIYSFNVDGILEETGKAEESRSPYWWLNAGGELVITKNVGSTIQGVLPSGNHWRILYAASNPVDTGNGYYPQNLFRLLTKNSWENAGVSIDFKITKDNSVISPNKNQTNGILVMTRYIDDNNLYYGGLRVDGKVVIKKKYEGTYYTLKEMPILEGIYHPISSPNILPHNEWLKLKVETYTRNDTSVLIRVFWQRTGESSWTFLAEALDDGKTYGRTSAFTKPGRVGIRSDFMDLEFRSFRVDPLSEPS